MERAEPGGGDQRASNDGNVISHLSLQFLCCAPDESSGRDAMRIRYSVSRWDRSAHAATAVSPRQLIPVHTAARAGFGRSPHTFGLQGFDDPNAKAPPRRPGCERARAAGGRRIYVYKVYTKNQLILKFMTDVPSAQKSPEQKPPETKGLPVKVAPSGALVAAGMARAGGGCGERAVAERGW